MKNHKNEKGITLVSLIMYIILTAIILAILSVVSISFRNNLSDMNTGTMQDSEFDKLNIQLLKEAKIEDNYINEEESTDTKIVFINGNTYTYVESDKAIYLNTYIKVAENIEECTYEYAEVNDKLKLTVIVKINGIQRILEYTFVKSKEYSLWDGSSSEPPVLIDANWYIYNAKQFKFFADYVNSGGVLTEEQENQVIKAGYNPESLTISDSTTVYLMRNLDLGARSGADEEWGSEDDVVVVPWTPIGDFHTQTENNDFIGIFEGNNHTIKGVYVSITGNFGGVFGNAYTIQNLTVQDSYIKASACAGGIVGAARGGEIINCHNKNTTVEGLNYSVGGIVGDLEKGTIKNCINTGKIKGEKNNVGGITGEVSASTSIRQCINTGKVEGTTVIGGIAGLAVGTVEKSYNKGQISGTSEIGGIAGNLRGTIEKCYNDNEGTITGTTTNIGGICGIITSDATSGLIQNTYNKGEVIAESSVTGYVGGIVGLVASGTTATINNNYNVGTITIKGTATTNIGGTIGYIVTSDTIVAKSNYYLSEVVTENGSYTSGTGKTDSEMKLQAFVDDLNNLGEGKSQNVWIKTNEYPALIGM